MGSQSQRLSLDELMRSGWVTEGLMRRRMAVFSTPNFLSSFLPHRTKYKPVMINTAPMILCITITLLTTIMKKGLRHLGKIQNKANMAPCSWSFSRIEHHVVLLQEEGPELPSAIVVVIIKRFRRRRRRKEGCSWVYCRAEIGGINIGLEGEKRDESGKDVYLFFKPWAHVFIPTPSNSFLFFSGWIFEASFCWLFLSFQWLAHKPTWDFYFVAFVWKTWDIINLFHPSIPLTFS